MVIVNATLFIALIQLGILIHDQNKANKSLKKSNLSKSEYKRRKDSMLK